MKLIEFYKQWLGKFGKREILLTCSEDKRDRALIDSPEELEVYVNICRETRNPAYVSVQPYRERDQPLGIEKLFFEFDFEPDPQKAWEDARTLANNIIRYYNATPLIKFSGRKGYHVDVFLRQMVTFDPNVHPIEFVKAIYERLQKKILLGLNLPTLDRQVIGDLKRLERVPYSIHEITGRLCQPVNLTGKFLSPEESDVDEYRRNGLSSKLLEHVIHELQNEEKWRSLYRRRVADNINFNNKDIGIRPCIQAALKRSLEGESGHMMRLAIACEFLNKGWSVDQVVSLFQHQADFKEEKSRYFVEHALKSKYKPFKCSTIRSLGFCLGDGCRRGAK